MSEPKMNARYGKFAVLSRAGACVALAAAAGCASLEPFDLRPDPQSAAAARVEALAEADPRYPRWSEFPAEPRDVPTPAQFAERVRSLELAQAELQTDVAQLRWTLEGSAEWAAAMRRLIDPAKAAPVSPQQAAETEEFARRLREMATPPPPVR